MQCFQQFDESFQVILTVVFDFDLTLLALLVQGNFRAESLLQVVFHALHIGVFLPRLRLGLAVLAVLGQLLDLSYGKAFLHGFLRQCDLLFFAACRDDGSRMPCGKLSPLERD